MIDKEKVYGDYHDKVFGYLYHAVSNPVIAEDLCSDVFLKIIKKLDSFDESKSALSTWIYNITRNTLYDYYRTHHPIAELNDDILADEDPSVSEDELELLAEALRLLERYERIVIIEKYYRRRTLQDIADKLGLSYFHVRTIHKTGLKKIKLYFEKD